jgi:hypothetical protein
MFELAILINRQNLHFDHVLRTSRNRIIFGELPQIAKACAIVRSNMSTQPIQLHLSFSSE